MYSAVRHGPGRSARRQAVVLCTALDFCSGCSMVGKVLEDSLLHLQVGYLNHLQDGAFKSSSHWRMWKTGSLWEEASLIHGALNPWCFFTAVPSAGEARYWGAVSCRQCSRQHVVASFCQLRGLFSAVSLLLYLLSWQMLQKNVVLDCDKAVNFVGKCTKYLLVLNGKWVVNFLLHDWDINSLWLHKRKFNTVHAYAF